MSRTGEARVVEDVPGPDLLVHLLDGQTGLVVAPTAVALPRRRPLHPGKDLAEDHQDQREDAEDDDQLHEGHALFGAEPAADDLKHRWEPAGRCSGLSSSPGPR